MGTLNTPTPPSPGGFTVSNSPGGTASDDQFYSFPQSGWVDKVHVYCWAFSGTTNVTLLVYNASNNTIVGATQVVSGVGTGGGWVVATFALNSGNNNSGGYNSPYLFLNSGYNWGGGAFGSANLTFGVQHGTGNYWWSGGSSPANRLSGTQNNQGNAGRLWYYLEYFPSCTITSVDAGPFGVGQTFHIHGTSFSSGINASGITLNGTNCPTYTIDSDTQITVTVPAGAQTGTVTVNSNAGSATSSGTVTISTARVFRSSVWTFASTVDVSRSSVQTPATEVAVIRSGVWTPGS